ncbi:MAG: trypsin-like peptidase domain-containing protein [Saprospiraceae bacterium]
MKQIIPIFISSLISALLAVFIYRMFAGPQQVYLEGDPAAVRYTNFNDDELLSGRVQRTFLSSAPTDFISAAEEVTLAVVNIRAVESASYSWWGSGSYGASSGSGVIISPDGYIVTNNHVIEDGSRYEVSLNDHREYEAKLIATDPSTDLALLKIKEENLPFLMFGNSDSLRVGEWVLAVGNPFNLESTVTAGIVSAKGRSIDILEGDYTIESFIQTDAAVNPGNSGGALVNTNGELIGINTAIITRSGKYEGYSFAIPATLVQKVISDLKLYGEVQRGLLGIRIGPVNGQNAKELGLPSVDGVYISYVTPGGGAEDAGLKGGDVIVGINNLKIKTIPELQEQVGRLHPGSALDVEYIRNGKHYKSTVILKDKNQATSVRTKGLDQDILSRHGFEIRDLTTDEKRRLRVSGVYVENIDVGSIIEKTEMDPGYIITKVGEVRVSSVQEVINELKKKRGKEIYLEGFYENYPGEYYYTFEVR